MSHIAALATRYLSDGQNNTDLGNDVWEALRGEAFRAIANEKALRGFINTAVLAHEDFSSALAALLARKLGGPHISAERLEDLVRTASADDPELIRSGLADLMGVLTRDPAAESYLGPFLYYKGYHALQWQRISHWLWKRRSRELAYFLQNRCSEVFAVDIHPAVPIGRGVFIDHATGVVIGQTAVIGNDVSILQGVTLGGTGKETGDRHPKIRDGVLLSVGAKVLGNIEIGARAKIGAGSVVLKSVPPCATVAGVPAKIIGWCRDTSIPGLSMDQSLPEPDYSI
ncbi:MAG: serine O-acetyltransferase [Rhodospirillaceae bacterium]